jgi:hypothetical protein
LPGRSRPPVGASTNVSGTPDSGAADSSSTTPTLIPSLSSSRLRALSIVSVALTAVLSGLTLLGWELDSELLKHLVLGLAPLRFNAALAFLLASVASAVYAQSAPASLLRRAAGTAAAGVVVLVGRLGARTRGCPRRWEER